MFKNKVIDRYMHSIMKIFKINAQVCIYFFVAHYVEFTFFEGKLDGFLEGRV